MVELSPHLASCPKSGDFPVAEGEQNVVPLGDLVFDVACVRMGIEICAKPNGTNLSGVIEDFEWRIFVPKVREVSVPRTL